MKYEDLLTYKEGDEYRKIPRKEYNQFIAISYDKDFILLEDERRKALDKFPNKNPSPSYRLETNRLIKSFLFRKNIPPTWKTPLFNIITGLYKIDFPLSNSISLFVGDTEMTGRTETVLWVVNLDTREPSEEPKIRLEITSQVTTEQILKFIKDYQFEIAHWQKVLKFPTFKNPGWKHIPLAQEIIQLRDEKHLSFSDISKQMSSDTNLRQSDCDYLSDVQHVKNLYYNFKKRIPGI